MFTVQPPSAKSSNKKGSKIFTFDLPLDERIVRTYCSQNQLQTMTSKYSQKVKLELFPPVSSIDSSCEEQSKTEDGEKHKMWTLRAQGRHRKVIKSLACDMIDRHNKIILIIKNIVKN